MPKPTQAGIYKASMREAEKMKKNFKQTLKYEEWALHFDGRKINNEEIQVVVLKNNLCEVQFAVLSLKNKKAMTIYNGLLEILNEYDLWQSIKVIICNTTSVNTGKLNGVVVRLQRQFEKNGFPVPQYIGCQHHILDLILKHCMDQILGTNTTSPNIGYFFIEEIRNNFKDLQSQFKQNEHKLKAENIKWRDDMQFLYDLGKAYRYYSKTGDFPFINFKSLPSISNARWNSRAIYALLCYILMPHYREKLRPICQFITGHWFTVWFGDHFFNMLDFSNIFQQLEPFEKAKQCFQRQWSQEDTNILTQRSNICVECSTKTAQDIFLYTKQIEKINLKFILSNK